MIKNILLISILIFFSYSMGDASELLHYDVEKEHTLNELTQAKVEKIENLDVRSFIKIMTENYHANSKLNFVTFKGEFPLNWIKKEDIEYLISIIHSKKKCCSYKHYYSSYISSDYAEVGGFAIIFLNSFINNKKINLGLNSNPRTDEKSIKKINNWYLNEFKKE
ncbi:hypothetical protein [Maribellus sediminis]|uniref:hypothetical protein n=1 Tax=Maribellus sediminis TaxID=2696285 RepID=UPI001431DDD4|nr:hypothetical protein [Maribellus sediminis]